jgi:hypothetical protein
VALRKAHGLSTAHQADEALYGRHRQEGKLQYGAGGDYWWVECGTCDTGWQVPHHGEEHVG